MPNPILARVLSGTYIPAPSFSAPLLTSTVPDISASGTTIAYTRATVATGTDHEGRLFSARSGEARFTGARRVENVLMRYANAPLNSTDDMTGANRGSVTIAFTGAYTTFTVGATSGAFVRWQKTPGAQAVAFPAGTYLTCSFEARGTGSSIGKLLGLASEASGDIPTEPSFTLTSDWQRFVYQRPVKTSNGLEYLYFDINNTAAGNLTTGDVVHVRHLQQENVTCQSSTAAGEYVSVGVLSAPYHGCGVDGVKYFNTDYAGTPIPSTTLLGYLPERAGTQILATADIRDMTTANWTLGATMTRARTSTGADGLVNTATRLTGGAVSATNTITTLITAAASSRTFSAMVKRITGTGPVRLTQDGFATNTDISSQLISGKWVLVSVTQSQLNAVMGIKIDTNGDAVDVDFNQFEAGSVPTSRIVTTGAARNADALYYPIAGNAANTGAISLELSAAFPLDSYLVSFASNVTNGNLAWPAGAVLRLLDSSGIYKSVTALTVPFTGKKLAATYDGTTLAVNTYVDGAVGIPNGTYTGTMVTSNYISVGMNNYVNQTLQPCAPIRNLKIYPVALTTAQVAKL